VERNETIANTDGIDVSMATETTQSEEVQSFSGQASSIERHCAFPHLDERPSLMLESQDSSSCCFSLGLLDERLLYIYLQGRATTTAYASYAKEYTLHYTGKFNTVKASRDG
jgi:hypothetical protein